MKCKIPEISWHNRDPVLSVDIQMKNNLDGIYRLASGGTDAHVLIWYVRFTCEDDVQLDLAADLSRHQRAVNVVKWSPNGELLASGDDESVIFIWKQKSENEPMNVLDDSSDQDKEVWLTMKVLRGHMEDVYDLSWSPNSLFLVSGSVDNSAIIWDVHKGKSMATLNEHKGFVQGVAWDPKNQHIATLSTDRNLRIYDVQTKRVVHRISKGTLPVPDNNDLHNKRVRFFHDDTLQTFFRRLCYTPDGKLLLTPAGVTDYDGATEIMHTAYAFNRYALRQPAIMLPCPDQYAVALRCCPVLFKLRPFNAEKNPPVVPLPYRMIFAMATQCSVYFYDTQQRQPFAVISNIHYTRLTDATWSSDGRIVVVSSTDGFCSLITFEEGELGEQYEEAQAVLDAVLINETAGSGVKKSKKHKENSVHKSTSSEIEKGLGNIIASREPLAEKIKELTEKAATPIAFRRKVDVDAEKAMKDSEKAATPIEQKNIVDIVFEGNLDDKTALPVSVKRNSEIMTEKQADMHAVTTTETKKNAEKTTDKKVATPIGIKRKIGTLNVTNREIVEQSEKKVGMPIAVKRKSDVKAESPVLKQLKIGEKPPTSIAVSRKIDLKARTEKVVTVVLDSDDEESSVRQLALPVANDHQEFMNDSKPATPIDNNSSEEKKDAENESKSTVADELKANQNMALEVEENCDVQRSSAIVVLKSSAITVMALPVDVVMDKEILGSDEKFDSPEKKCRPVTPISVRRHPRTPNNVSNTPTTTTLTSYFSKVDANISPISAIANTGKSPRPANKRATPIAIRRTPRVLNTVAPVKSTVDTNIAVEEALDAWPLPLPLESPVNSSQVNESPAKPKNATAESSPPVAACELTTEHTEDMRLVYEDTVEDVEQPKGAEKQILSTIAITKLQTPSMPAQESSKQVDIPNDKASGGITPNKTPRRVALKTISTPKSRKKIIE